MPVDERRIVNASGPRKSSKSRQGKLAGALTQLKEKCDKADSVTKLGLLYETLEAVVLTVDEVFEEETNTGVPFVKQRGVKI